MKKKKIDEGSSAPAATTGEGGAGGGGKIGEPVMSRDPLTDEVRVVRECGVADKKGQRHQINRPRTVSTRFGQACVDGYLGLVTSALSQKMDDLASPTPTNVNVKAADGDASEANSEEGNEVKRDVVVGVISYTEELSKNVVRTGVPPPLPKYTKVAMWRGEDICLNQLGAGDMKRLLVGITWCEPKGSMTRIDLDLSVMVRNATTSDLDDRKTEYSSMRKPCV